MVKYAHPKMDFNGDKIVNYNKDDIENKSWYNSLTPIYDYLGIN